MEEIDNDKLQQNYADEDEMFLHHVVQDDHELLYLDTYLNELFGKKE